MSYLSTSENVGFSSIPQNISDVSCASQYKMAVEGVSGNCSEVNMFILDSSGDEQTYLPHLSENFFHNKFKVDPNELYTFHDTDVIAGEITVSQTEDNFILADSVDVKSKLLESPNKELDLLGVLINGEIKQDDKETKKETITNGHYPPAIKLEDSTYEDNEIINTKVQKVKDHSSVNEHQNDSNATDIQQCTVNNLNCQNFNTTTNCVNVSINSVNTSNIKTVSAASLRGTETFLDVFKREQGVLEATASVIKSEPAIATATKVPTPIPKKLTSVKTPQSKTKRGRGPTVHEALQRIPQQSRVITVSNSWHVPGDELFCYGPLNDKKANAFRLIESSSSDDDMPAIITNTGPVCVEEIAAESRSARLDVRRDALRRHAVRAITSQQFYKDHKKHKALATLIKKQISNNNSSGRLPVQTVNHLLAMRGMSAVLTSQERRRLRESGWSGGESTRSRDVSSGSICEEEKCTQPCLPCGRYCFTHVTLAPEQQLYAACTAVFAGGERCKQPLLPLQDQTPLCPEHAWKRDNYELLSRECRPQKASRKRAWVAPARAPRPPRPPRRPKRRRRPLVRHPPQHTQSLSEINACSNSSTYDSSEGTVVGEVSENEYIPASETQELEVEHVPADDILDPSVLSQIPDEAFTEFFNQAEGAASFAEGSELAAALEAVLDERVLDERALDTISDCVFTQTPHSQVEKIKCQVPAPVSVEMSSSAPS